MRFLIVLLTAFAAVPAAPAPGAVVVAEAYAFAPGGTTAAGVPLPASAPAVVTQGAEVVFVNAEATFALDSHTMTSDACLTVTEPCWFDTGDPAPQAPGEHASFGTAGMPPGDYGFFCAVHPQMRGILRVL